MHACVCGCACSHVDSRQEEEDACSLHELELLFLVIYELLISSNLYSQDDSRRRHEEEENARSLHELDLDDKSDPKE